MSNRIYLVTHKNENVPSRLVRAGNPSQALRHVAQDEFSVEVATQDQLVLLVGSGRPVETAGFEPVSPPPQPAHLPADDL